MADLKGHLNELKQNLVRLIDLKVQLETENNELSNTIVRLNKEISHKENIIESLKKQIEIVEQKPEDVKHGGLTEELTGYIKEIESCITLINNLN